MYGKSTFLLVIVNWQIQETASTLIEHIQATKFERNALLPHYAFTHPILPINLTKLQVNLGLCPMK